MEAERTPALAERTGSARCVSCGTIHPDMPLDVLHRFACGVEVDDGQCWGELQPVVQSPNATGSATGAELKGGLHAD